MDKITIRLMTSIIPAAAAATLAAGTSGGGPLRRELLCDAIWQRMQAIMHTKTKSIPLALVLIYPSLARTEELRQCR